MRDLKKEKLSYSFGHFILNYDKHLNSGRKVSEESLSRVNKIYWNIFDTYLTSVKNKSN